ncbi:MAG: DUF1993 family protein [Pseudomonadota bacterium]
MDGAALFAASVPVFRHYLERTAAIIETAPGPALAHSLQRGAFSAGVHFHTAQGFVPRALCPLLNRAEPDLGTDAETAAALLQRHAAVLAFLAPLSPADFTDAPATITHRAGEATLTQPAAAFLTAYALPNFFFHATAAHQALRAYGLPIGKADFDGFHRYAPGTSLV